MIKSNKKDYSGCDPILVGGIGEKTSNGGTQYFQQNRIYYSAVSTAITTVCMPFFVVVVDEKSNSMQITR